MNAKQQARAAYRASIKAQARIKAENEQHTQEKRYEPHNTAIPENEPGGFRHESRRSQPFPSIPTKPR